MSAPDLGGWYRSAVDRGGPYRAEQLPAMGQSWIVVDRLGGNCWTRGTGHIADARREVAEAAAAAWNAERVTALKAGAA